ncbi:MAG: OmpA family protein [Candidatus Scalindua sediminis]|nr:OmpA family protein [Candidatus Scalindua sediminis]
MGFKFSFVRYLFLFVIILSVGCSGLSGLREENLLLSKRIQELETEQYMLESERRSLEEMLQGTGATVNVKDGKIAVTLPSSVFFNSGQATLKKKAKSSLTKVGNAIKNDFPYGTIRVEGHTDSDPIKRTRSIYASNWELSAKRAASVLHFLVGKCGLDSNRLYIAGFGEYQPIASNNTKKGKKQNRRVEIVILASR